MKNLEKKVKDRNETLNGSLREFGDFVLNNYPILINSNSQNLSDASGISTGTIYRYIKIFGYTSLESFSYDFLISAYKDRRPIKHLSNFYELNLEHWDKNHFELELENVGKTGLNYSKEDSQKAAKILLESEQKWIVGWRLETSITGYLNYAFNYMLGNTNYIRSDLIGESILSFRKNDVLIVMFFKRYSSITMSIVKQAKAKGMQIIAITDSPESPIKNYADITFVASGKSFYFLDSYTAALSTCNALIGELSKIGKEQIYKNIIYQEMFFDENNLELNKEFKEIENNE